MIIIRPIIEIIFTTLGHCPISVTQNAISNCAVIQSWATRMRYILVVPFCMCYLLLQSSDSARGGSIHETTRVTDQQCPQRRTIVITDTINYAAVSIPLQCTVIFTHSRKYHVSTFKYVDMDTMSNFSILKYFVFNKKYYSYCCSSNIVSSLTMLSSDPQITASVVTDGYVLYIYSMTAM